MTGREHRAVGDGTPGAGAVRARARGKVNLILVVGERQPDGYHPLRTVFQSLALSEQVTARHAQTLTLSVTGDQAAEVPLDGTNLAARAAELLAAHLGREPRVGLELLKGVPVAGGMAGGSADAAATLVALDELWQARLTPGDLLALAAQLGADVPFTVLGGTALGTGRGDVLTSLEAPATFHWVLALRSEGLSTPAVYAEFDRNVRPHAGLSEGDREREGELIAALGAGDPVRVGAALHNDLQQPAVTLVPDLSRSLAAAREANALGVLVSGSGPTVAALALSADHAEDVAAAFAGAGASDRQLVTTSSPHGARVASRVS